MKGKPILGTAATLVGVVIVGMVLLSRLVPAAERAAPNEQAKADQADQQHAIAVDVVIEDLDLAANTITARATQHVIPPHDKVGGAVFMIGTTDSPHKHHATKFVRLPVMPPTDLKKLRTGLHVILRLEMLRPGCMVVVGIEELTKPEKIGVEWLDAIGT